MHRVSSALPNVRLKRPRLLPVTIAAMSALLAIKSVVMVQAVAEETTSPPQADAPAQPTRAAQIASPVPTNVPPVSTVQTQGPNRIVTTPSPPVSEAEHAILMDLRHRRELLDSRAHDLDVREAEIMAADRRLGDRVQQLSKLQDKLETLESSRQRHSEENWTGLVKVYETMKPREAASIFDSLDMQVLLQVIDRMQDRRAAPVLAAMQPDRARLVTQMLAEMRTRATTPRMLQ